MNWKSRLGLDEESRKHTARPEGRTTPQRDGMTEIVVVDKGGAVIVSLNLSFMEIQSEAEVTAGADGDPIAAMVTLVQQRLHKADAELSSAALKVLRKTVSQVAMNPESVKRLELTGTPVQQTRPAPVKVGSPSLPPELLENALAYPNERAGRLYEMLVGLDDIKQRLVKEAIILTQPQLLQTWARKKHGTTELRALATFDHGAPLIIFAGDVGVGKTALAESFGDAVAKKLNQNVVLLRMSIQTRGSGIVGDMSKQITKAIGAVDVEARRIGQVTILLLDEADALAETREIKQMHHEDRAGVNALIQGVDHLRGSGAPVLVIFCTNRLDSIDPAIRRRAVDIFEFPRPNPVQRRAHLERLLGDLRFTEDQWQQLVDLTGPQAGRAYGFTYSDIADRLVRTALIEAFPDMKLSFEGVKAVVERMVPTRPFGRTDLA